jgi:hypothetical protein
MWLPTATCTGATAAQATVGVGSGPGGGGGGGVISPPHAATKAALRMLERQLRRRDMSGLIGLGSRRWTEPKLKHDNEF